MLFFLAPTGLQQKPQRQRGRFTRHQLSLLERRFVKQQYISPSDREEIAHSVGISGAQVTIWFQNRIAKYRRDLKEFKSDIQAAEIMDNRLWSSCKLWEIKQGLSVM